MTAGASMQIVVTRPESHTPRASVGTPIADAVADVSRRRGRSAKAPVLRSVKSSPGEPARSIRSELEQQLLQTAQAFNFYSGIYMHLGHGLGMMRPERLLASSVLARRRFGAVLSTSDVARYAAAAHKPFAWSGNREAEEALREIDAAIAVPVQDHAQGPAVVAFLGVDLDRARAVVQADGPMLSALAADLHLRALAGIPTDHDRADPSAREIECLRLAAVGGTVHDAAEALGISARTVEFHWRNITTKLGANNKTHAVALAVSRGLFQF